MNPLKIFIITLILTFSAVPRLMAQINTEQVMRIGQNALYFEDYMLSIQYFNQVIQAKPYLARPYFLRAIAKLNLEDYAGAEEDATTAIDHNPFINDAYEVRGVARQNLGKLDAAIDDYRQSLKLLPENRGVIFNMALAQEENKDYEGAEASFAELLRAHPNYDSGYLGRAKLRLALADTVAALEDINHALEINKNATNGYVMRADIAIHSQRDYARALDDMNEAIKLEPRYAGFFINRAFLRYNLDDYFGAMADYDYAIQLDPLNSAALFNRGLLRAEVHDNNKAIDDFSRVLQLNPDDYKALYNRALLYKEIHDYRRSNSDLGRVIEAFPTFAGAYFVRSENRRLAGDMRGAEADYRKSMALAKERVPVGESAITPGGNMAADSTGVTSEPQEAVAARFTSLLTIENNADIQEQYSGNSTRGRVQDRNVNIEAEPPFTLSYYTSPTEIKENSYYLREIDDINSTRMLRLSVQLTNHEPQLTDEDAIRRHFESIEYYDSYLATHKPRAIDYFGRAMDFMTLHNYQAAIADLNRAIELTPDFTLAYLLRADARFKEAATAVDDTPATERPGQRELAAQQRRHTFESIIADLDRVAELSPRMAIAHYNKGFILLEMQDYTQAVSSFNRAIELKPDMGEAYYNRGFVYFKLGNKPAGTADLSKAGELGVIPSYNLLKRMTR
ncbi:MAG: tetratricopeptide repeat protein [Muribaculaceae bacterium]